MTRYRRPPGPIARHLERSHRPPALLPSPDGRRAALLYGAGLPSIAEVAEPWLPLAGVRVNPRTATAHGPPAFGRAAVVTLDGGGRPVPLALSAPARIAHARWSPDGRRIALARVGEAGVELWTADAGDGSARRVTERHLSGVLGVWLRWVPDGSGVVAKLVAHDRGPAPVRTRTYQNLLRSALDEALFEHHCRAEAAFVSLEGEVTPLGEPGVITEVDASPDGAYLLVRRLRRPYSRTVPCSLFPLEAAVLDRAGRRLRTVADLPAMDDSVLAPGAAHPGPRHLQWRADAPSTLAWVEARGGGDVLFTLDAPFSGAPRPVLELERRFTGMEWGDDHCALVFSRCWETERERWHRVDPGGGEAPRLLLERPFRDRYGDPGRPLLLRTGGDRNVLHLARGGGAVFLAGRGATPGGEFPFLDRMELDDGSTRRLWRCGAPYFEEAVALLDEEAPRLLTLRESAAAPPAYTVRDLARGRARALPGGRGGGRAAAVARRIVRYARADGVAQSATLLLPPGFREGEGAKLPLLLWVYPEEHRERGSAGQVSDSPHRFSDPFDRWHRLLLRRGYAVLEGPFMPLVGEKGRAPNDTLVEQLEENARATLAAVAATGAVDVDRVAVAGHSYGAFLAAHLVAHTGFFRAAVAISGAYNRTLTPFGFQHERRTFWDAPEVYLRASPFRHADRIRAPVLLIHGEADDNPGTPVLQSERFFQALQGNGATARLVVLPAEGHGFAARESVLHVLAEIVEWLDLHLAPRGALLPSPAPSGHPAG